MEALSGPLADEQPDIAYQMWKIIHKCNQDDDPMVSFVLNLRSEASAQPNTPLQEHLMQKLETLKKAERDLLNQIEVKSNAREKLAMEMKKFDVTLKQLDEKKKSIRLHQKYTDSCLKDLTNQESMLKLDQIKPLLYTQGQDYPNDQPPISHQQQLKGPVRQELPAGVGTYAGLNSSGNLQSTTQPTSAQANAVAMEPIATEAAASKRSTSGGPHFDSMTGMTDARRIDAVLWHLQNRQVKEGDIQRSLSEFEMFCVSVDEAPWEAATYTHWVRGIHGLLQHLLSALPVVQAHILRCLIEIVKRWNSNIQTGRGRPDGEPMMPDVFVQDHALDHFVKLLQSVNLEVKADVAVLVTTLTTDITLKDTFGNAGGIHALVQILKQKSNDFVLEKALTCVWHMAMSDTNKTIIREAGGLVAIVDLLHTDNDVILENATIALGYLTRDDSNKIAIRKCNGLEKLIATLYYPSESIQSKAAGALWNCASNTENKVVIRQLGSIAALIDLLSSRNESVQENAAGGLWNCAVDTENKRLVRELGGLQPLIHLLSSPVESVVENASGTLWNCAAIGENRVAIRKLGGLDPLLKLLLAHNENIQENAAGAIRNCAINDQNKVALKDLGGLHLFIDLLDKTKYSVLEKLTSTLWICSINNDNKHVIRECNGFPKLLKVLDHENFSIKEKALGILRNCSTLAENRLALISCSAIAKLVEILSGPPEKLTSGMREYAAATLWNVARDDKVTARNEGAIQVLTNLLSDRSDSVVENAAGSLLSLTLNTDNRDHLRDIGGIQALVKCLSSTNEFILENVTGALKNCTSNNERNQKLLRDLDAIPKIIGLLKCGNENVVREAALCLKNLAQNEENNDLIGRSHGVTELVNLVETSPSDSIKKVATFSLSTLAKNPSNKALIPVNLILEVGHLRSSHHVHR
ncbi:Vacuolar protein 8 [Diplonema papillatum]|nr:Vacuolar protein 8 [Diplonema papillatum]